MAKAGPVSLMRMAGRQARRLWLGCALAASGVACNLLAYVFLWRALTDHMHGGDWLAFHVGLAIVCHLASHGLAGAASTVCHHAAFDILHDLRVLLLEKFIRLPLGYFSTRQVGRLKRVVNENVEVLELFFSHQLPDMAAAMLAVPLILFILLFVDWRIALAAIAILPLLAFANMLMMRGHGANIGRYFGLLGQINAQAVEYVQGIEVIKGARGGDAAFLTLRDRINGFRDFASSWQQSWLGPWALFGVTAGASMLFVLPAGLWLVTSGRAEIEVLLLALLLVTGIGPTLLKLSLYSEIYLRVIKAQESIQALLEQQEFTKVGATRAFPADHTIRFENLSVVEDDRTILGQVTAVAPAGRITAIIGPSGAGKTTLVRSITRHVEPADGRVSIGGIDVQDLDPSALIAHVAPISQEIFLFDDSIMENIRIGRSDAEDDEVVAAARAARVDDFVSAMPDGYQTRIGENGAWLSGGQRQRLALARALLAKAPILLLDEVTADVDPYHERLIQEAINAQIGKRTVIIVSHRLDSVQHCDQMIFLSGGRLEGAGGHEQLLATCPSYRTFFATQEANLRWTVRSVAKDAPRKAGRA